MLAAHLAALVVSYGPPALPVAPGVVRLWAMRGLVVVRDGACRLGAGPRRPRAARLEHRLGARRRCRRVGRGGRGGRHAGRDAAGGREVSAIDWEEYAERVLQCVEQVPRGRATTYGAIAEVVGAVLGGGGPRLVGSVMAAHGGPGAVVARGARRRLAALEPPGRGAAALPRGGHPACAPPATSTSSARFFRPSCERRRRWVRRRGVAVSLAPLCGRGRCLAHRWVRRRGVAVSLAPFDRRGRCQVTAGTGDLSPGRRSPRRSRARR